MGAILDVLKGFADFIASAWNFVIGIFQDIAYLVKLTADFVVHFPDYFGWLPPAVLTVIASVFSIAVVYKVLGREG